MSMDLTGIRNQNEYYTNHYFSSVFEENARDTLKQWQDEAAQSGDRTPWAKLNAFASRYFTMRDQANRQRSGRMLEPIVSRLASEMLTALGYPIAANTAKLIEVEQGVFVPAALEMTKPNGAPALWVILCRNGSDDENIMESKVRFAPSHASEDEADAGDAPDQSANKLSNEELLSKVLFGMDEPPRWVLFVGLHQIALIDRNKWNEKRFLIFQLDDIFGRKESTTLQAMSVLLHKDSLCPAEGASLLDTLDSESHKHASGVSKDLKYALRECIEMLGNEVVRDMRERQHTAVFGKDLANDLTIQCLRYMYRILFMLFIEAKPELGYAPMKAEAYALGYSFESLREIADNARANMDIERDGFYLKDSLDLLFRLIYEGYPGDELVKQAPAAVQGVFRIDPLKAHIFDPRRTELIEKARIRNGVLLDIIDRMSTTRAEKGKRRGRISYSNLGINQLGSVYEALLSYRGFFAEEDLYEVKRSGEKVDDLDVGYFVPERELDQYDEDERVREGSNPTDPLRVHRKGEFIYRLAGREREKSASYYTPEVLTNCLVKYALKELLEGKTADEILHLTICEPAMGSAAFLNEAVTQLAEAYLARKEKETGETVPHEERVQALQKVKMYIADRNVYGIDLNPVAVELAEVSLWLNTIYQGAYVPWFRTQIVNGNSLIGARRQCYALPQLTAGKGSAVWYENAPVRIEPGKKRRFSLQAYHFLMGDPGMCSYTDKVIKALEPEKIALIKAWSKQFCKAFTADECDRVLELSATIDRLWDAHTQLRREIGEKTTDPLSVWGQPEDTVHTPLTIREKDAIYDSLYLSRGAENASPYARLKAVMDYWCALWFWPIDKADELPTRQEFLFDVQMLLGMGVWRTVTTKKNNGQLSMFGMVEEMDPFMAEMAARYDQFGAVNLDKLREDFPRLRIAHEIAQQQHFFHWELEFADVFAERGGFDLVIGNPPWQRVQWEADDFIAEIHPVVIIKDDKEFDKESIRAEFLTIPSQRHEYITACCSTLSVQAFLGARTNYVLLAGATNLYKCFLPQAWEYNKERGICAFVHQEGVFEDPKGGLLRHSIYQRLRHHYQFINQAKLFSEVHPNIMYSLNVYGSKQTNVGFWYCPSLLNPEQIITDDSGTSHGRAPLKITRNELAVFAQVFDNSNNWSEARLLAVDSAETISILLKLAQQVSTIGAYGNDVFASQMWNETTDRARKIIKRSNVQALSPLQLIYSGSHIGVCNPLLKTPSANAKNLKDFTTVDLTSISNNYLQRSNYEMCGTPCSYIEHCPVTPWREKYVNCYKVIMRLMVAYDGERALYPAIVPRETGHIDTIMGLALHNLSDYAYVCGLLSSPVLDFLMKLTKKKHVRWDVIAGFPIPPADHKLRKALEVRVLRLNCLTSFYSELWEHTYSQDYATALWSKSDVRLTAYPFSTLRSEWNDSTPIRSDFARRQCFIETEVLTAIMYGLTLDDLRFLYHAYFPNTQKYEADTWYDANGRIVFTVNRSLVGVGVDRKRWETEMKGAPAGTKFTQTIIDDTQPGGPVERVIEYVAPFDRCDREQDYETAWAFFSQQG